MGLDQYIGTIDKSVEFNGETAWGAISDVGPLGANNHWYWRKANQIHKWFVDNVQGGEDDCGAYIVEREQLEDLACAVNYTLTTKDTSKLPPQAGFFFGSTQVDDFYWEDLENTRMYIDEMFAILDQHPNRNLFYVSSW